MDGDRVDIEVKSLAGLSLGEIEELRRLAKNVKAHPFQTIEWMHVCRHDSNVEPHIIILRQNEEIAAYWIICFRELELAKLMLRLRIRDCITRAGPVIINPVGLQYIDNMVDSIIKIAKIHRAKSISILSEVTWRSELGKYLLPKGFTGDDFCTYLVDLSPPLEVIYSRIDKKSGRWAIKKAQKNNTKIIENSTKEGFEYFSQLRIETWERSGIRIKDDDLYERFKPLIEKDMCRLFLAHYRDEPVAGLLLVYNEDLGIYYSGASSDTGFKVGANDLLQWHAITFCKNRGIRYYDLLGMECNPRKGTKQYNLKLFKSKWGGELISTPRYTLYSPMLRFGKRLLGLYRRFGSALWGRYD